MFSLCISQIHTFTQPIRSLSIYNIYFIRIPFSVCLSYSSSFLFFRSYRIQLYGVSGFSSVLVLYGIKRYASKASLFRSFAIFMCSVYSNSSRSSRKSEQRMKKEVTRRRQQRRQRPYSKSSKWEIIIWFMMIMCACSKCVDYCVHNLHILFTDNWQAFSFNSKIEWILLYLLLAVLFWTFFVLVSFYIISFVFCAVDFVLVILKLPDMNVVNSDLCVSRTFNDMYSTYMMCISNQLRKSKVRSGGFMKRFGFVFISENYHLGIIVIHKSVSFINNQIAFLRRFS